jgi:DNA-binding transcriptional ArsR family regulator
VTPFEALAQPTRREIVRLLWNGERPAGDIAASFDLTFGAISQHLRVLQDAGVVSVRREWRQRFYRVERAALGALASYLESMWQDRLIALKRVVEAERRSSEH